MSDDFNALSLVNSQNWNGDKTIGEMMIQQVLELVKLGNIDTLTRDQ